MAEHRSGTGRTGARGRRLRRVTAVLLLLLPGCLGLGISANPFRLGNPPAGTIVRTHAKPALWGFYRDFDPAAHTVKLHPVEGVNQVGTQHVLVASVCDEKGNGLRNRRVEWHVTGAGHIVEVDESGLFPGRGYMVDDHYAVTYTNYASHTLTRGNDDPNDDVQLRPGQSWCVITSATEGETQVTCHAPGIHDWQKHKVFVVKHWIDATARFPGCSVNPAGQPHPLVTQVVRTSDGSPVGGYVVRYRILDGPPAVLDPGGAPAIDVVTGADGTGAAVLRQVAPTLGVNRVAIEVIRPADRPTGRQIVIGRSQLTKTWVSPQLSVHKTGPPTAVVGQQIPYQITVSNTGTVASGGGTIRDTLPPGLTLVTATPPATLRGQDLLWSFGPIQPHQSVTVQFACTAAAPGTVTNCADAVLAEGLAARSCAVTEVLAAALGVAKTGPTSGVVGQAMTFTITVTNRGTAPAANVMLVDAFDAGFVHQTGSAPVQLPLGDLPMGQSRSASIVLTPRAAGRLCNRVSATAQGGLSASTEYCVEVVQPQLAIEKQGSRMAYVGAPVDFQIKVRNSGSIPAANVVVRDPLPPQLAPREASEGGAVQGSIVTWSLGTLGPGQERVLRLLTQAVEIGTQVCNVATVSAEGGINVQSSPACLDIRGVPAILSELIDRFDPVPVGSETTYSIQITNQGSVPATGVVLECRMPDGLDFVAAEGAVGHKVAGRSVVFEPFSIAPGKRLLYQVQARATKPGDHRFEARITAEILKTPVIIQESTTVYDPGTGATGGSAQTEPPGREPEVPDVAPTLEPVGVTELPRHSGESRNPGPDRLAPAPVDLLPIVLPDEARDSPEPN